MADRTGNMRSATGWVLAVLLGLWAAAPAAEVYRWVDEHGRVHYGDRPRHADQPPLQLQAPAPAADPELEQRRQRRDRLLRIFAEDRAREQAATRERAAAELQRRRDCQRARESMHRLERGGRYYTLDGNGERRYLSDTERARAMADWRAEARRLCDAP